MSEMLERLERGVPLVQKDRVAPGAAPGAPAQASEPGLC